MSQNKKANNINDIFQIIILVAMLSSITATIFWPVYGVTAITILMLIGIISRIIGVIFWGEDVVIRWNNVFKIATVFTVWSFITALISPYKHTVWTGFADTLNNSFLLNITLLVFVINLSFYSYEKIKKAFTVNIFVNVILFFIISFWFLFGTIKEFNYSSHIYKIVEAGGVSFDSWFVLIIVLMPFFFYKFYEIVSNRVSNFVRLRGMVDAGTFIRRFIGFITLLKYIIATASILYLITWRSKELLGIIITILFISSVILSVFRFYKAIDSKLFWYSISVYTIFISLFITMSLVNMQVKLVSYFNTKNSPIHITRLKQPTLSDEWGVYLNSIQNGGVRKFFIGSGPSTYNYVFNQSKGISLSQKSSYIQNAYYAPSVFWEYMYTFGIIGTIIILYLTYTMGKSIYNATIAYSKKTIDSKVYPVDLYISALIIIFLLLFLPPTVFTLSLASLAVAIVGLFGKQNISISESNDVSLWLFKIVYPVAIIVYGVLFFIVFDIARARFVFQQVLNIGLSDRKVSQELLDKEISRRERDYLYRQRAWLDYSFVIDELQGSTDATDSSTYAKKIELLVKSIEGNVNDSIRLDPYNIENYNNATIIYAQLVRASGGNDFAEELIASVRGGIAISPYNYNMYYILYSLYKNSSDAQLKKDALGILESAYALRPTDIEIILALGDEYRASGETDKELKIYKYYVENIEDSMINDALKSKYQEIETRIKELE